MVWVEKRTMDGMSFYMDEETNDVSWHKPESLMSDAEKADEKGEWAWVPHPTDMWQPARVEGKEEDGSTKVTLEDGSEMLIPKDGNMKGKETGQRKQHVPLWELKKGNLRFLEDDLVMLDPVNEAFIIRNLAQRYEKKEIYTWVGAGRSVLVSVNPYQDLDLYGDDQIDLHRNKPPNKPLPPHVFAIANDSYDSMSFEGTNQSILISGESGAGKTEATKQCLKFLAGIAGSETNVEDKILVANPLLEAFGNAKTIRNINSSRFGKWMEVYFNKQTNKMVGSQIFDYLLERSRVVHQQANERNYHIFYELCQDADAQSKYSLGAPESFNYLNQSGCINVPEINDAHEYASVRDAMARLEFTDEEQESITRLTAAVLHLGNITFDEKHQSGSVIGSEIKGECADSVKTAAELLQITEEKLKSILCFRTIRPKAGADSAVIPLNPTDATVGRDSLAMGIYGKLFSWMVGRVNDSLGEKEGRFIGILDIFGFEIFDNNSFEQLCINFANEKLQQLFNRTTFKEEEELYQREGVPFTHIEFLDNQPVLDLVESRPKGVLPCLDDECLLPEGSDIKFMNKIEDNWSGYRSFMTDQKRRFKNVLSFEIVHYAGVVKYDASEFMTKNLDTVFPDMYAAMSSSENALLGTIFEDSNQRIKTLSFQFRQQLNKLMDTLYTTESRFIRCIKPNETMSKSKFVSANCVEQLRYSGVFEAVEIRRTGYPFRYTHKRFCYRFSCINPDHKYRSDKEDHVAYAKEILDVSKQDFSNVQIGNNMVLYRANEYKLLKLLRNLALETLIPRGQSVIRGGVARAYSRTLSEAVLKIQDAVEKGDDYAELSAAIEFSNNCFKKEQTNLFRYEPYNLKIALKMQEEQENWLDLQQQMEELSKPEDPNEIYEKLKAIDEKTGELIVKQAEKEDNANVDFYGRKDYRKPKLTDKQIELRARVKELLQECERGILDKQVLAALAAFDKPGLIAALERSKALDHRTDDIKKAEKMLKDIETLDADADKALQCVSRSMMKAVMEKKEELKQDNEVLREVEKMLNLDEIDFVQAEYERAKEVGDESRRIHREIRLMSIKYDAAKDTRKYALSTVGNQKSPEDFAKGKMFGKKAAMDGQMVYQKKPIHNALTYCSADEKIKKGEDVTPEDKQAAKQFKAEAKANFKSLLGYMGDKKVPDANACASDILARGLRAYKNGDDETLVEMYFQVIKQLSSNPTANPSNSSEDPRKAPENGTSYQNGLALLAMMLSVFPASTQPYQPNESKDATFDDAVVLWVQNNVVGKDRPKYVTALHNTKYSEPGSVPNPAALRNDFSTLKGKFEIESDADTGPTSDKIELYVE